MTKAPDQAHLTASMDHARFSDQTDQKAHASPLVAALDCPFSFLAIHSPKRSSAPGQEKSPGAETVAGTVIIFRGFENSGDQ
jgi:hypothetical protein